MWNFCVSCQARTQEGKILDFEFWFWVLDFQSIGALAI